MIVTIDIRCIDKHKNNSKCILFYRVLGNTIKLLIVNVYIRQGEFSFSEVLGFIKKDLEIYCEIEVLFQVLRWYRAIIDIQSTRKFT